MRPILMVAVGASLLASGCVFPGAQPLAPIKFGNAWVVDHDERATYDAIAMRATIAATGNVRANDANHVSVTAWLVARACPLGPTSTPTDFADRGTISLGNVTSAAYSLSLNATVTPGTPYSVLVQAQPTGLGPAFPVCHSFVAAPANLEAQSLVSLLR